MNNLFLHPQQYCILHQPLKLAMAAPISQAQWDALCQALTQQKTPLMFTGKQVGETWCYYLLTPDFSIGLREAEGHLACPVVHFFPEGQNPLSRNPKLPVFLAEIRQGIHVTYRNQCYRISGQGVEEIPEEIAPDATEYHSFMGRMHRFFSSENHSLRVSQPMQRNIMDVFAQQAAQEQQLLPYQAAARDIYTGATPATYLYNLFHDFSVKGYEDLSQHPKLAEYLRIRTEDAYPPSQMQLEALVKGALTEDVLLVSAADDADKHSLVLDWAKYALQQGKRVLLCSGDSAFLDDTLERLSEDRSRDMALVGCGEDIPENRQGFTPGQKILSMRHSAILSGQRLETQLKQDLAQIDNYVAALRQLQILLAQLAELGVAVKNVSHHMTALTEEIKTRHQHMQLALEELECYRSQAQRYTIFLEESHSKNFFIRWRQRDLRRRAQEKLDLWQQPTAEVEDIAQQKTQHYAYSVNQLQQMLGKVRSSGLLSKITQTQENIQQLRDRILLDQENQPALAPNFESELRHAQLLSMYRKPQHQDLHDPDYIKKEIAYMDRVRQTGEKLLATARHWLATAQQEDPALFHAILLDTCQTVVAGNADLHPFDNTRFDVAIFEDAHRMPPHQALLLMSRATKTLMAGAAEPGFFGDLYKAMVQQKVDYLMGNHPLWLENTTLPEDPEEAYLLLAELAEARLHTPLATAYTGGHYTAEQMEDMIRCIIGDAKKTVDLSIPPYMPEPVSEETAAEPLPEEEPQEAPKGDDSDAT